MAAWRYLRRAGRPCSRFCVMSARPLSTLRTSRIPCGAKCCSQSARADRRRRLRSLFFDLLKVIAFGADPLPQGPSAWARVAANPINLLAHFEHHGLTAEGALLTGHDSCSASSTKRTYRELIVTLTSAACLDKRLSPSYR